jgi:hypothetical protein
MSHCPILLYYWISHISLSSCILTFLSRGEWYEPILRDFMTEDPDDREDRTTEIFGNYEKLKEHMKKAFGDLNEKLASERRIRESSTNFYMEV